LSSASLKDQIGWPVRKGYLGNGQNYVVHAKRGNGLTIEQKNSVLNNKFDSITLMLALLELQE